MTRYLLDTNIVSKLSRPVLPPVLDTWMAGKGDEALFIASLSIAEIRRGILRLPAGRKRNGLTSWFSGPQGPEALFAGRILPFDTAAALAWGVLMAEGERIGRPRSPLDMIVAATAEAYACIIATDNERDFAGLRFINPSREPGTA